jgi:ammonia channel protein AmtB
MYQLMFAIITPALIVGAIAERMKYRAVMIFLVGVVVTPASGFVTANDTNLGDVVGKTLWLEQLKAMGLTLVLAMAGTFLVGTAVKWVVGFRLDAESGEDGLDQADHGEAGYHLDDAGGWPTCTKTHIIPARCPATWPVQPNSRNESSLEDPS